jgi:hypothetical protein
MNSNDKPNNSDLVPNDSSTFDSTPATVTEQTNAVAPGGISIESSKNRSSFVNWFVGLAKASLIFVGIAAVVAMAILVVAHFVPGFSGSITMGDDFNMPIGSVLDKGVAVTLLVWLVMTFAFAIAGIAVIVSLAFAFLATVLALAATIVMMVFSLALMIAPLALPIWFVYWIGHKRGASSAGQANRNAASA